MLFEIQSQSDLHSMREINCPVRPPILLNVLPMPDDTLLTAEPAEDVTLESP